MIAPAPVDPTDTLAVLKAAREWIRDPERWTQGRDWRDENGHAIVNGKDRDRVVACCGLGALSFVTARCSSDDIPWPAWKALREAAGETRVAAVVNDGMDGHARMLAVYDKAIATLEAA